LSDELNDAFWAEENTYLEARAVSAADTSIFSGLKRLASAWYKETQNRYPKDYHVIVHDLDAAARGQGEYIRIQGESRYWIEILTLALRFEGLMSVESSLFDTANQDPQVLIKEVREAAVRWVKSEPEIRKMMEGAFSSSAGKLDRELTSRFSRVTPTEVMRAVYFRGVAQRDTIAYDSFQLAQDLYFALYE
jgi:hypothetical protein